ncbi:hypothetical protein [Streptomyces sp. TLI_146]|uniref:hypothetical protein n=1 Tax=Streptomyces sp. TLI_146 TaxID=1938858 RepID=UPI000C7117FD|nr:hypothetical protein [Streptomyces sp. TLI_146]PKV82959.1 hypothetical protein BX283_0437 [Streptomyces sp. TLI_146]
MPRFRLGRILATASTAEEGTLAVARAGSLVLSGAASAVVPVSPGTTASADSRAGQAAAAPDAAVRWLFYVLHVSSLS